jgi:transposase
MLLTPAQVAERLSVPLKTVYDWSYKPCSLDGLPLLPVVRLGRRVRVSEAALDALPGRLAHRAPAAFSFFSGEDSSL